MKEPALAGSCNVIDVRRALKLLADPEAGLQLQAAPGWTFRTFAGHALDDMVRWVQEHERGTTGIYYALNPVRPDLPTRVKVPDALRRRWLLVDVDRVKAEENKDFSATDAEHEQALGWAEEIHAWLGERNWPAPLFIDSGNGYHLVYRLDLPADEETRLLVKAFLAALVLRWPTVGSECYDARRISKLPGTWARRGVPSAERPHRLSRIVSAPDVAEPVSPDLIRRAIEELTSVPPSAAETVVEADVLPFSLPISSKNGSGPGPWERCLEYLGRCEPAVSGQKGHDKLFWAARAAVWGFDLGPDVGQRAIEQAYNPICRPPWSSQEIAHKCQEANEKPYDKPRGWLLTESTNGHASTNGRAKTSGAGGSKESSPTWRVSLDDAEVIAGAPESILSQCEIEPSGPKVRAFEMRTLGSMLQKEYVEPRWIIPGIMSEGLNILAGAPKAGKSMLALNLALTVAAGGLALGEVRVAPADVFYLSLEDKERRVKARSVRMLKKMDLTKNDPCERLRFATCWPRQSEGGLGLLEMWRRNVPAPGLIIIDVWNRFGPRHDNDRRGLYTQDADDFAEVKDYCDRFGLTVLVLHHTRKPGIHTEGHDYLLEVSGSLGITGTADGIMVLLRARQETRGQFHITGRDVGEAELVLEFDVETMTWRSLGKAAEFLSGEVQTAIIAHLKKLGGGNASVKDIAAAIGHKEDSIRKALNRMRTDGLVRKVGANWGWPAEDLESGDLPL